VRILHPHHPRSTPLESEFRCLFLPLNEKPPNYS
jgi:hypothetical protein